MKMIKKLWGALIAVTVLAVGGLFVPTYTAKAEGTVDVTENVTASSWIEQSELNVTYLSLGENVIPAIGYGIIDNAAYTYAQDYIAINGKTIKEINTDETLGASEWTYTIFPSSADVKYQLPVIVYVNNGQLEIKIHDNYAESLGDCVQITAKAGLYFENEGTRYEVTADKTCTVFGQKKTEVDITDGVSIEGWDATGNGMELTYTRIRFPEGVLGDIDFRVMDSEEWTYLQEYISINGRTVADINANTDTTDYVFATFPSTADVKYEVPVIVYENEDVLEVKFHNTYLETLEGDLTITLEAGFYIEQGENKYVVSEDVSLVIEAMTETDITADVSIEGWNATGNGMELTYTIIRFPAGVLPETLNYQVIDTETWAYM